MRYQHAAILLVFLHAALAVHAAWNLSPVWDEIVYPAAGYDLLTTGHVRTSLDHPPLGKVLVALPLFLQGVRLQTAPANVRLLEPFRYGFDFVHQNRRPARWMIFLPRLMNVFLSCILALMVSFYARGIWGDAAGILTLTLYAFLPSVLARASLALLEMPLAVFMLASAFCFARREKSGHLEDSLGWCFFWVCAVLTKATGWILLPGFWMVGRRKISVLWTAVIVLAISEVGMRVLGNSYFSAAMISRGLSAPQASLPVYFAGRIWNHPIPFQLLIAWFIKTPLSVIFLGAAGIVAGRRRVLADPVLVIGITSVLTFLFLTLALRSRYVTTSHVFWFYPFMCLAGGSLMAPECNIKWRQWAAPILAIALVCECLWVHPQYLAYFNIMAGGSAHGYYWLDDSDQDWGQGLPALAQWMKKENLTQILLGYAGAGDPRIYGISYQDVLSPALITAAYRGEVFPKWPGRIVMALGTKVAQTEGELLRWLLTQRKPIKIIGNTFLIYDLTGDREALNWLTWFYQFTRRPGHAVAFQGFSVIPTSADAKDS